MKHFPLQATWNALPVLQTLCWAMEIRSSHVSWCHGDGIDVLFFEHLDHWPRQRRRQENVVRLLQSVLSSHLATCRAQPTVAPRLTGSMGWRAELPVGTDFPSSESGRNRALQVSCAFACQHFNFSFAGAMHIWSQWRWNISHQQFPKVYTHF